MELELNKIYCEDCLDGMQRIPDNYVDLVVTDPPYRIHAKSGGGLHNEREWLSNIHNDGMDEFEPKKFLEKNIFQIKNF